MAADGAGRPSPPTPPTGVPPGAAPRSTASGVDNSGPGGSDGPSSTGSRWCCLGGHAGQSLAFAGVDAFADAAASAGLAVSQQPGSVEPMSRWWTSDHHFGHANIIEYCNRPFASADEMNKAMVDRWNDLVADGDEVWIVGDLVLGQLTVNLSAHVWRLKGRKILVPGNHDACWQGQKKGARQITAYLDLGGIARIVDDPVPVEIAGQEVQVNHFPYDPGEPGRPARFAQWRPEDTGGWLLCGHIHERWRQHGKQINVGVDAWNFAPVADDAIAEMIESGPARRPCPVYARTR